MKSGPSQVKILILALMVFIGIVLTTHSQSFSLSSVTSSNMFAINDNGTVTNTVLPVIEMKDVPLGEGIKDLANKAHVKLGIDNRLLGWSAVTNKEGEHIDEPSLSFRWTNMTARQALFRLIQEHHLILDQDPLTMLSWISSPGLTDPPWHPLVSANASKQIPLIEFEDVPITIALENLARQAALNYMLDPRIGYGQPGKNGQIKPEPVLTIRWENVTAEEGLVTICKNYGLMIVQDTNTDVILIRNGDHYADLVSADFYKNDTNVIPIIEFRDVPLSVVLKNLAKQAHLRYVLSARVDTGHPNTEPQLTFRLEDITAKQAFAAICENHDLDINLYPGTDIIEVEPAY